MPAPRSCLVLRHELCESLGYFESILDTRGIPFSYHDSDQPVSLEGYMGIIIMGGPMSANDPLPALTAELNLIERALKDGLPLLGICLGSQLIAKALGARVYRNPQKEIGWAPVYFTEAGQADPLFRGMDSPTTLFHWHGETFDLPAGACWLAYSDRCRHQAFRYGPNVYALQFHPEITAEMIADWCLHPTNCADLEGLDSPIDPRASDSRPLARHILERWLERVPVAFR